MADVHLTKIVQPGCDLSENGDYLFLGQGVLFDVIVESAPLAQLHHQADVFVRPETFEMSHQIGTGSFLQLFGKLAHDADL